MSLDSFYLEKYLKYKAKYLELKNIIGGADRPCYEPGCVCKNYRVPAGTRGTCVCKHFNSKHDPPKP